MRRIALLFLLAGCASKASNHATMAATSPGFASPVVVVDGPNQGANILGTVANPIQVISQ